MLSVVSWFTPLFNATYADSKHDGNFNKVGDLVVQAESGGRYSRNFVSQELTCP